MPTLQSNITSTSCNYVLKYAVSSNLNLISVQTSTDEVLVGSGSQSSKFSAVRVFSKSTGLVVGCSVGTIFFCSLQRGTITSRINGTAQRCLLAHFVATLEFIRSEFTCP